MIHVDGRIVHLDSTHTGHVIDVSAQKAQVSQAHDEVMWKDDKHRNMVGDGELDKPEFRQNVKAMGVAAESKEIDELFDSPDKSGSGTLDMKEVKKALTLLIDEAIASDKMIKELNKEISDQVKVARMAQVTFKRQKRTDDATTAKEEEANRLQTEAKAAAVAEAKAVRMAAAAEKSAATAQAKADFEARVAAKRTKGYGFSWEAA